MDRSDRLGENRLYLLKYGKCSFVLEVANRFAEEEVWLDDNKNWTGVGKVFRNVNTELINIIRIAF